MEHFWLVPVGLYAAGLVIRWLFPAAARALGWVLLVSSVSLAIFLLFWGLINFKSGDGPIAIVAILFAFVVGAGGVFFGSVLVWGKQA